MITPISPFLAALIVLLLAVGCERGEEDPASRSDRTDSDTTAALDPEIGDTVDPDRTTEEDPYREEEDSVDPLPSEIYYHLSEHDWYRRGRPLIHAGGGYLPEGPLAVFSADAVDSLGNYQGVTFYAPPASAAGPDAVSDTVWVPVFEHYWQPFVRGGDAESDG